MYSWPLIVAGFLIAALLQHLVARLLVWFTAPAIAANKLSRDRVEERLKHIDRSDTDAYMRVLQSEPPTFWPIPVLMGGLLSLSVAAIVGSWIVMTALGGPLSTHYWWAGVVYFVQFVWRARGVAREARQNGASIGCGIAIVAIIVAPISLVYSLAPIGVMLFDFVSRVVSRIARRVAPPGGKTGELPKVAMLFM